MAGFPEPEVGLVISYSYLWKEEEQGLVEGRKDRPCAMVLTVEVPAAESSRRKQVAVAPITHSLPYDPNVAIEIPPRIKEHLGLDGKRSWVILEEVNIFTCRASTSAPSGGAKPVSITACCHQGFSTGSSKNSRNCDPKEKLRAPPVMNRRRRRRGNMRSWQTDPARIHHVNGGRRQECPALRLGVPGRCHG